jgi:hypothetical protein
MHYNARPDFPSIRDYPNMKWQVLLQAKIKYIIMPVQTFLPLGTTQTWNGKSFYRQIYIIMPIQTFLPCSRKKGLFGHIVPKTRKAWQTMQICPSWISEVHQTYPCHMKFIWACRECLGHPISKKKRGKRSFFEGVIPKTSFLTTLMELDYK